jgi:thioredoxin reductase (NADPH)
MVEKVIILGSGPAGLSAAIYSAREGFEPVVIRGHNSGGQLILTTLVENIPGFPQGVIGADYIKLLNDQAKKFGTRFVDDDATKVDLTKKPFKVFVDDKAYESNSLIIATGANPRWLGIESEKRFIGRGMSNCATCDGSFFKGKDVIVVGGGDTAMEDSLFLTMFVNSVTIIHRRDGFRASKIMQDRVLNNPKIKVAWNSVITEIKGDSKVKSAVIKNMQTGQSSELNVDGVFVAIGYDPNSKIFHGQLKLDEQGYIIAHDEVKTEIDGVFVAGDVADRTYRQAVVAAGSGVKAALEARAYLLKISK